jgi:DNA-binding SARP family transcriptional activator
LCSTTLEPVGDIRDPTAATTVEGLGFTMVSRPAGDLGDAYWLRLFDSFSVGCGDAQIELKSREQRLVALLALEGSRTRSYLAGMLWPESTEARAAGSLRAAVWRLEREAPGLLRNCGGQLGLDAGVWVDVAEFTVRANRITALADEVLDSGSEDRECLNALDVLTHGDLLSGWYEDWVLYERARLQQMRLSSLESIAELLIDRGYLPAALTAALCATSIEPLRESAHRLLVRIHLANGNFHDAIRAYRSFGERLVRELGIRPSRQMDALVQPLLNHQAVGIARGGSHRSVARVAPAVA